VWWIGYRLVPSPRVSSEPLSGPTIASRAVPARVTQFHGLGPPPHLTRENRTTRDLTGRAGTPRGSLIMLRSEVRFFLAPREKTWSEVTSGGSPLCVRANNCWDNGWDRVDEMPLSSSGVGRDDPLGHTLRRGGTTYCAFPVLRPTCRLAWLRAMSTAGIEPSCWGVTSVGTASRCTPVRDFRTSVQRCPEMLRDVKP
jgi:hypothetical protein